MLLLRWTGCAAWTNISSSLQEHQKVPVHGDWVAHFDTFHEDDQKKF